MEFAKPIPVDLKKFSMWVREARDWAREFELFRVSHENYMNQFQLGRSPKEAAHELAKDPSIKRKKVIYF